MLEMLWQVDLTADIWKVFFLKNFYERYLIETRALGMVIQGGHGTGKTGNLVLTFSRQGKHREFCCSTGKIFDTQGK